MSAVDPRSSSIQSLRARRRSVCLRRDRLLAAERLDELDRKREDDRRVLFGGDLRQRLKVAQLERRRRLADNVGRLLEGLGRRAFTFGGDHLQRVRRSTQDLDNGIWSIRLSYSSF